MIATNLEFLFEGSDVGLGLLEFLLEQRLADSCGCGRARTRRHAMSNHLFLILDLQDLLAASMLFHELLHFSFRLLAHHVLTMLHFFPALTHGFVDLQLALLLLADELYIFLFKLPAERRTRVLRLDQLSLQLLNLLLVRVAFAHCVLQLVGAGVEAAAQGVSGNQQWEDRAAGCRISGN